MTLDSEGSQRPVDCDYIQRGDLVEVSVQLDVEIALGPHGLGRTSIYLSFNRVVRVLDGAQLREVSILSIFIEMNPWNAR